MNKNSGSNFEREIAKSLSLWWTNNERDDIFWRSSASGARFTQRRKSNKDTKYQGGDLTFTDPIGEPLILKYNIEIKKGYSKTRKNKKGDTTRTNWCLMDIIDSQQETPLILEFWEQSVRDAKLTNRIPILIFKRPSRSSCIVFEQSLLNSLRKELGMPKFIFLRIVGNIRLVVLNLKEFLKWTEKNPNILVKVNYR